MKDDRVCDQCGLDFDDTFFLPRDATCIACRLRDLARRFAAATKGEQRPTGRALAESFQQWLEKNPDLQTLTGRLMHHMENFEGPAGASRRLTEFVVHAVGGSALPPDHDKTILARSEYAGRRGSGENGDILLHVSMVNWWLFTIDPGDVRRPRARARLARYQRECREVLERARLVATGGRLSSDEDLGQARASAMVLYRHFLAKAGGDPHGLARDVIDAPVPFYEGPGTIDAGADI